MTTETRLTYEDVLEYLDERKGEECMFSSHPTFGEGGPTILGLSLPVNVVDVVAVKPYEEQWLDGRAGARVRLASPDTNLSEWAHPESYDGGLVLTREWFGGAYLDETRSVLRLYVRANQDAEPLYPPVGEERDPEETRQVFMHDLVGWGFAFDFDGSPPYAGRWSDQDAEDREDEKEADDG